MSFGRVLPSSPLPISLQTSLSTSISDIIQSPDSIENVKDSDLRPIYFRDISLAISSSLTTYLLHNVLSHIVFDPKHYHLSTSELHVRWPKCNGIPPHQDSFYHALSPLNSFKLLIPLTTYNISSGGLFHAHVPHDQPTLVHTASDTPGFSSYIKSLKYSEFKWSSHDLRPFEIAWHSLGNIHYANPNTTTSPTIFVVCRYDHNDSIVDESLYSRYLSVLKKHQQITKQ